MRITSNTSFKEFGAAAYGLPPSVITGTNEANCHPHLDIVMEIPPMAEGPSMHDEWLEECIPQLASGSEDDELYEESHTANESEDTTDEESDDDDQVVLQEPWQQRKRTNESDMYPASKRAREPQKPPTANDVPPPRPRTIDEKSRHKKARKFDFTGKEEDGGKARKLRNDNKNDFCFPEENQPPPSNIEGFS